MNVYDFDETILKGDTEVYFHKYIFNNYKISFYSKARFAFYQTLYNLKLINKKTYREGAYYYIKELNDLDSILIKFWDQHKKYIKDWYLKQRLEDDVIISGTPMFLLEPIMNYIGCKNLIATILDTKTIKVIGKPCFDIEKVNRFYKEYPGVTPDNFYSDSLKDKYMAKISKKAWLIKDLDICPWPKNKL